MDSHIKNLRHKIREFIPSEEVIRTVYGVGYNWSDASWLRSAPVHAIQVGSVEFHILTAQTLPAQFK